MQYKAIIFDMDGTIISSEDVWEQGARHLFKSTANLTDEECDMIAPYFKGASLYTTCNFIKNKYNTKESVEELMKIKEDFFATHCGNLVTFIDGFDRFHERALQKGLKTAIGTNSTLTSLESILQHIPLKDYFQEHIYSVDHVGKKPKPQPDVFLHAANKLEVDPKECIVIEDSSHGIAAAKTAGMFCIGINTGKDKSILKQADMIIDHYDEIDLDRLDK